MHFILVILIYMSKIHYCQFQNYQSDSCACYYGKKLLLLLLYLYYGFVIKLDQKYISFTDACIIDILNGLLFYGLNC